ncbi:MAG: hypothetical protein Q9P01_12120 [Anaerolineae bacterium]|nr:hypothetical protein [Anaerolineae bacterium]MDQ7035545.1 hypothetical protein [Anaerolineae bacterium]
MSYTVRTLFLQNFFSPAHDMADYRRGGNQSIDRQALLGAMKRTELADKTLESELHAFAERGYQIISLIPHPIDAENPYDLLITVIFSQAET